jgi:peptide/nickel transport system ATP-binding protein
MLGGELMLRIEAADKVYKVGTFGTEELHAVRQVSFDVEPGEVVSLIGESGSGKSTIGKMVLRLVGTTAGSIRFEDKDVLALGRRGLRDYYRNVQGVFQDPFSSYNPIFKVDRTLDNVHRSYFSKVPEAEWRGRVEAAIASVGLAPAETLGKFPHQLSGGQLQRLLIARALLLDIRLLVADEVISMLDASTRVDVLNLLGDLKQRGLGILFITHDLSLGNYVSDKVVILYQGRVVERGVTAQVFANPLHPYTRALLASVPQLDRKWEDVEAEQSLRDSGLAGRCLFHEQVTEADEQSLDLAEHSEGHFVGCFRLAADDACPARVAVV